MRVRTHLIALVDSGGQQYTQSTTRICTHPISTFCFLHHILTVAIIAVRSWVAWLSGVRVNRVRLHRRFLGFGCRRTSSCCRVFEVATSVKKEKVGLGSAFLHSV